MTTQFCPVCGNPLAALDGCDACRTPSSEFPWPRSLALDADEVRYDLSDWEPLHRAVLTDKLRELDVPYRFESGIVMVVAAPDEERVDTALDETEAPTEEELALAEDGDEEAIESDEAAMDALSALYTAADRLVRHPDSAHAVEELEAAATAVKGSAPPWGFDAQAWSRIGDAATALREELQAGTLGEVMLAAETLRDLVRDHV
ncbi:MAG: hypothetical protein JOZ99_09290 [Actinobacteria bacterium]|nr:hypothetical protein [Actinomycetota bacterium]